MRVRHGERTDRQIRRQIPANEGAILSGKSTRTPHMCSALERLEKALLSIPILQLQT